MCSPADVHRCQSLRHDLCCWTTRAHEMAQRECYDADSRSHGLCSTSRAHAWTMHAAQDHRPVNAPIDSTCAGAHPRRRAWCATSAIGASGRVLRTTFPRPTRRRIVSTEADPSRARSIDRSFTEYRGEHLSIAMADDWREVCSAADPGIAVCNATAQHCTLTIQL